MAEACRNCGLDVAQHVDRCEHCGYDVGAPNVRAARDRAETEALEQRYRAAIEDAHRRNCDSVVKQFQDEVAKSRAVVCKTKDQLHGIAAPAQGSWVIPTYHQQVRGGARAPDDPKWAWARCQEERWFPNYTAEMHYGALSLSDSGVSGWGEVALVLGDKLIEKRATVGETNAVYFAQNIPIDESLPPGRRAQWHDRDKLCVAKLSGKLVSDTPAGQFPEILLTNATSKDKADFVEVHVYGKLTLDSVSRVRAPRKYEQPAADLWQKLRARNIVVEFFDEDTP